MELAVLDLKIIDSGNAWVAQFLEPATLDLRGRSPMLGIELTF